MDGMSGPIWLCQAGIYVPVPETRVHIHHAPAAELLLTTKYVVDLTHTLRIFLRSPMLRVCAASGTL
jgi:hypothetical protein